MLASFHYIVYIGLMMVGFYTIIAKPNLLKKVMGLGILQTGVFLLFISAAAVDGGSPPITDADITMYANPLPHVLILTAIVVSVSTTAVALALCVRIRDEYGTIEEDEILAEECK